MRVWVGQWLTQALEFAVRNDNGGDITVVTKAEPEEARTVPQSDPVHHMHFILAHHC